MLAFHNDRQIKKKYIERVKAHALADEIIKGTYWDNGKGCAVGCTVHSSSHAAYETEMGIPRILARLEDGIFENLPNAVAKEWPLRFLEAVDVGADLTLVWPKFAVWMLTDEKHGVLQFAKTDRSRESVQAVADLYQLQIEGADVASEDWQEARAAADAAYAADAADAYAAAYAADAAYAYAAAAADAAAAAADAAYAYAARQSKREEWRVAQSEKLISLLMECRGPK